VAGQKERDPSVSGKLVFKWTIAPNGRVISVELVSTEFATTWAASCLKNVILHLRFPAHKTQGEPTTFPFKF
jgi:hypothetical protein